MKHVLKIKNVGDAKIEASLASTPRKSEFVVIGNLEFVVLEVIHSAESVLLNVWVDKASITDTETMAQQMFRQGNRGARSSIATPSPNGDPCSTSE